MVRPEVKELYQKVVEIKDAMTQQWLLEMVFRWQWWFGVSVTIVPWVLWIIFRKRQSSDRLLYAAFFTMIIASWLDYLGSTYGMWVYDYKLLPTIPAYIPWHFSLLPVTVMFFLQYAPHISPYLKAMVLSALASFVAEPFLVWINTYELLTWKYIYSFPVYFVMYLLAHYLSRRNNFAKI